MASTALQRRFVGAELASQETSRTPGSVAWARRRWPCAMGAAISLLRPHWLTTLLLLWSLQRLRATDRLTVPYYWAASFLQESSRGWKKLTPMPCQQAESKVLPADDLTLRACVDTSKSLAA